MPKRARGHVPDPAPEQAVVERRNVECPLQEQIPQVSQKRGANADDERSKNVPCVNAHVGVRKWVAANYVRLSNTVMIACGSA